MTKALKYFLLPFIFLCVLVAYYPTLTSSFHLDDFEIIVLNDLVDAKVLPLIKKYPTRWLVFLSYWLCLRPWVLDLCSKIVPPESAQLFSLHVFNLILHSLNSWLIYLISLPLVLPLKLRGKLDKIPTGYHLAAVLIALFFALIPLQTQPVVYIGQRFTLLSSLFYLLTLFFVTRAYFAHWPKLPTLSLAVVSFVIGLFCKEIIVTAPIACLVLLWLFEASPELKYLKNNQKRFLLLELLAVLFLFVVLPTLIFCHLNQWNPKLIISSLRGVGGTGHVDINVEGMSRLTYFLTQPSVILFYIALFFSPSLLCVDHDIVLCTSFLSWQWIVPVVILLGCLFLFFKIRHKYPLASWGFFFFIFPLLPQSTFVPTLDLAFEHRMYLSVAGLVWLFADVLRILAEILPKAFRYALIAGLPILLLIYSVATFQRGKVWENELTLWGDAIIKAPDKQRVVINFYSAYLDATKDYQKVIDVMLKYLPNWHKVHPRSFALLGNAYQMAGEQTLALNNYLNAIEGDKTNPILRYNVAILYLANKKPGRAIDHLNRLVEFNPEYADGYYLRGIIERYLARNKEALKDFKKYLKLAPHGENVEEVENQIKSIEKILNNKKSK